MSDQVRENAAAFSAPSGKRYTYADYLKLDDDSRYELVEGVLVMVPAPGTQHQLITGRLFRLMADFVERHNLGMVFVAPTEVYLDEHNTVQPDVLYIATERLGTITETNIQGAPDLVVEVLSPATARRDRLEKSRTYLKYGVKEYWLVDPRDRLVEVRVAEGAGWKVAGTFAGDGVLTSPLLPGIRIELEQVFAPAGGDGGN